MIEYRHCQGFLRRVLADDILVQMLLDGGGRPQLRRAGLIATPLPPAAHHLKRQLDAGFADAALAAGNQWNLRTFFHAAKGTMQFLCVSHWPLSPRWLIPMLLSTRLPARRAGSVNAGVHPAADATPARFRRTSFPAPGRCCRTAAGENPAAIPPRCSSVLAQAGTEHFPVADTDCRAPHCPAGRH